ncbi:MAG: hypothetical protein CL878_14375 [Dehalococcoidia bacterium]|nr:hypothetical protein [Dehalococcoidia bacterium]
MASFRTLLIVAVIGLGAGVLFEVGRARFTSVLPGQAPAAVQALGPGAASAAFGQVPERVPGQATAPDATPIPAEASGETPPPQGRAAGGTVGAIESIEGDTIVLTTPSGPVTVALSEQTQIQGQTADSPEPSTASRSDLASGARVLVQGPARENGTINAETIQVLPAGSGQAGQRGAGRSNSLGQQ